MVSCKSSWPLLREYDPSTWGTGVKMAIHKLSPGGGETICPLPMAIRLVADLRPSADGSAVHTSLVAKLQAASVLIA